VEVGRQMQNALQTVCSICNACFCDRRFDSFGDAGKGADPADADHTFARDPNSIGPARDLLKVRSL
jgi:hypothetical protein